MSEQYSATDEQASSNPLWQRLSQRLRQLTDQAGQKLGQYTDFEQAKQHAITQLEQRQSDQDPIQRLREQLPNLSRQLLVGRFASVSRLASQLMPHQLMDQLTDQVLEQAVQFAELLSGNDALYDELGVLSLSELRQLDLTQADALADRVASRNRLLGATEGAATGLAGFVGAIADLPLSAIIVLRTIYQTAECYGYDLADLDGRQHIYQVLADTDWGVLVEKQTVLLSLVSVQQLLKQGGIAGLQKMVGSAGDLEVFEKLVQEVAASLNVRLPENLTGRALPIAGAAVGAFYNTRLINSVAALAQASFRQQRLADMPLINQATASADVPVSLPVAEISAEAVFGHAAAETTPTTPKKRVVRVKKKADGELIPSPTDITPNNDTQH